MGEAEVGPAARAGTPALPGLDPASRPHATEMLGRQPLRFEENRGQVDPAVRYVARSRGYDLFLADDEAVIVLRGAAPDHGAVLRMRPIGGRASRLVPMNPLPGKTSYLVGNDPARWRRGLVSYERVRVHDACPGVDVVYYGNERQLEFDLVVAPGVDPSVVTLGLSGSERLEVNAAGDLVAHVAGREVVVRKPLVYQEHAGARREVPGAYVVRGPDRVGFRVGAHDARQALVIDPVLLQSTYLGGENDDAVSGVTVDASGSVYIAGYTSSTRFPTTDGALQAESPDGFMRDAFVTKIGADGALAYSTYLGGDNDDLASDIAVDSKGRAWVVGYTWSTDFPTLGPRPSTPDGFVAQLAEDGSSLTHARLLGGSNYDFVSDVVLDASDSVYVAGSTSSTDFPTVNAFQACARNRADDVFLAKLDATDASLTYSTCLGGTEYDAPGLIRVGPGGALYVAGVTGSPDFPTLNPVQPALAGGPWPKDAFVTKLDAAGALVYSTYLGGSGYENEALWDFAVDADGNAYIVGETGAPDFPTANAFQPVRAGSVDGYVTKLDPLGRFVYSTYLGGTEEDRVTALATDKAGNVYLTGSTLSDDFPTRPGALQPAHGGQGNAFLTTLDPQGAPVHSTFLGGTGVTMGEGLAIDSSGSVYVTGLSRSPDFPTPPEGWPACPGRAGTSSDVFVAKVGGDLSTLDYSVCLGGSGYEGVPWILIDPAGDVLVAGTTSSADFPATPGAPQTTYGGGWSDAFLARIGDALPPAVGLGGPYTVAEGSSVRLTATASDPQGLYLSYDWDLDGDGTFELENAGPTVTYSAETLDGPAPPATLGVRVTSTANATATATATVTVTNVAPTATSTATPADAIAGQCVTFSLMNPRDPSAADTAAGFRYSFDCDGNGAFDVENSATATFACRATAPALSPVVTIADKDGGISTYQPTVAVLSAQDAIEQSVVSTVEELVAAGVLTRAQGSVLIFSAELAIRALELGDVTRARRALGVVLGWIEAVVRTGRIPEVVGQALIQVLEQMITILEIAGGGGGGSCPVP